MIIITCQDRGDKNRRTSRQTEQPSLESMTVSGAMAQGIGDGVEGRVWVRPVRGGPNHIREERRRGGHGRD
jgi:hypothetical protein